MKYLFVLLLLVGCSEKFQTPKVGQCYYRGSLMVKVTKTGDYGVVFGIISPVSGYVGTVSYKEFLNTFTRIDCFEKTEEKK